MLSNTAKSDGGHRKVRFRTRRVHICAATSVDDTAISKDKEYKLGDGKHSTRSGLWYGGRPARCGGDIGVSRKNVFLLQSKLQREIRSKPAAVCERAVCGNILLRQSAASLNGQAACRFIYKHSRQPWRYAHVMACRTRSTQTVPHSRVAPCAESRSIAKCRS